MKTNLTLKVGSFYFLSSVNLMRNNAAEVDLSVLTEAELKGLKAYINAGSIQSSEDISQYHLPETEQSAPQEVEEVLAPTATEEVQEPVTEQPEALEVQEAPKEDTIRVSDEVETEVKDEEVKESNYEQFTAKELKNLVKERNLETKATSKRDLVNYLEEEDKNAK